MTTVDSYTNLTLTLIQRYRCNVNSILPAQFNFLMWSNRIHMWRGNAVSPRPFVIANNRQAFFVPQLHRTASTKQEYPRWQSGSGG